MAHTLNHNSSMAAVYVYKAVKFIDDFFAAMAVRREQRQTFKTLQALSDRELNDIGISRGDIRSIANDTWDDNKKRDNTPVANDNLRGFV